MLRVFEIRLPLDHTEEDLVRALLERLGVPREDLRSWRIARRAVDARARNAVHFVYLVDVDLLDPARVRPCSPAVRIEPAPAFAYRFPDPGPARLRERPVIVGTGPAGLFAALLLAEAGYFPLLLERGQPVERRVEDVRAFLEGGAFQPESNIPFGEGGAGTFSDGKLYTLIGDIRRHKVFAELAAAGAPAEVLFSAKPHIGTDNLRRVVRALRDRIVAAGGEVRFGSRVTDFLVEGGAMRGVVTGDGATTCAEAVVLAIGHSARDTLALLHARGAAMEPKPFAIGVRIEHLQGMVDRAQYGPFAFHPRLGAADYKLVHHGSGGRSAYTFCMCPGGEVVPAASEADGVVTNGMSAYARDGRNANSALLVNVRPEDFGGPGPLAGVEFQRRWEQAAFALGGGAHAAPVQTLGDFLRRRASDRLGEVVPTYQPGHRLGEVSGCLPDFVARALREAIPALDRKLRGFAHPDAVITGVETRSSSPVRIARDKQGESSIRGLYPIGEGAGYAGGIVSAAVDGIRAAERIAERYAPLR